MMTLLMLIPDGKQATSIPDLGKDNAWYRETLAELLGLLAAGRIKPVVAERIRWLRPLALTSDSSAADTRARWFSLPASSQDL